ncbi:gamma-glutamyltransferase [Marinicella rhabdoformis]|uniref:gamma-glutamyltransferase n=1 Tax=Marinicella rhabdoformis TaxID=2580566 RepID=UPI0015D07CAA|nr:gamma-glutamyltransferase [Marinicella rhabdoformis]
MSCRKLTRIMPAYAIASGHYETSHAAAEILNQGGNAYDAVLAAMMMSFVAEPLLSSPGGGGFMLAGKKGQQPKAYNFFPQTPSVNPIDLDPKSLDFYPIHGDFGDRHQEFHIGADAAAVPTVVAGIYKIHEQLACLPLSTLAQPAIKAARRGVKVNTQQAFVAQILQPITSNNETAHHFFGRMKAGGVWKNEQLADFLDSLTKNSHDWFYQGEIAQFITQNSLLTAADFENAQASVSDALHLKFRNTDIYTTPTPSSGGEVIIQQLLASKEADNQTISHNLIRLKSMQKAAQQRQTAEVTRGTSHISVTDTKGNLASMTLSNGEGNGIVLPEHGFMLNNFLGEEDLNPNGFFKWKQGDPLRSMMAPSLIINNQFRMALGSGGSNRIKTTLFQVIDRICHGDTLKNAINAPRCHYEKGHLDIEHGFNAADTKQLKQHCPNHIQFEQPSLYFGGVNAALSGPQTLGYADFRRHGCGITGIS